ncbi:MAG: methyltransferase domain-containing protein [Thermoleophilaceae bacterium]|nr:methyltransferase domain-containing protein [Thermoleophilaceae bacterium]
MDPADELFTGHNKFQRDYFERADHPTLNAADSLYLRRHVEAMVRFAGITSGERVLEVGCGVGRYTFILAEQGIRIEGLDLSPQLLAKMRERNEKGYEIPLHAFDLLECPPEMYGQFDAVIGFFVLHHVHDLDACFATMAKLVRPGGRVAFLEPNPANPLYYVQIFVTKEMAWAGERGMLKMKTDFLEPAMEKAGLRPTAVSRFGFFPPFITNRRAGARLESALERVPVWHGAHPFQLFGAERPQETTQRGVRDRNAAG